MVLAVPTKKRVTRPAFGRDVPPPSLRSNISARIQACGHRKQYRKTRNTTHTAPFVRNASIASGLRYPLGARTARPLRCVDHDDLHPRAERCRARRNQSAGSDVTTLPHRQQKSPALRGFLLNPNYAASRDAFLRSCSNKKRLRIRIVFGVISTNSSSSIISMADSNVI